MADRVAGRHITEALLQVAALPVKAIMEVRALLLLHIPQGVEAAPVV
jgi:hypothetical protein